MIFGWKKGLPKQNTSKSGGVATASVPVRPTTKGAGVIRFDQVTLAPCIENLSLEIPLGSWLVLYGTDEFAKALFCDLCFSYIKPQAGRVHPVLRASDVSFLGRSTITYGHSLTDHLACGVSDSSKEALHSVASAVLSKRFGRHLTGEGRWEFSKGRAANEVDLDERDHLEIAEANLLLQRRAAAVIDTGSDLYQIASELDFQHSDAFLQSGKTLLWLVPENSQLEPSRCPWVKHKDKNIISLSFPDGSRAGHIN